MPSDQDGFNYFDIVRAGIHLVSDPPSRYAVRIDPEGERKAEERRKRAAAWAASMRLSGRAYPWDLPGHKPRAVPPLKTLHLQWSDGTEGAEWHDENLHINLETKRLYNDGGGIPFLGRERHGSGAIGVLLFAAPVLLLLSPLLVLRARRYEAREERAGMSRHAIALFEKLRGQLDDETEELLAEALKNEWLHDKKMARRPTLEEARAILGACRLVTRRFGETGVPPVGEVRCWYDAEGDEVAKIERSDGHVDPPELRVCGKVFTGPEALALLDVCATRFDHSSDD